MKKLILYFFELIFLCKFFTQRSLRYLHWSEASLLPQICSWSSGLLCQMIEKQSLLNLLPHVVQEVLSQHVAQLSSTLRWRSPDWSSFYSFARILHVTPYISGNMFVHPFHQPPGRLPHIIISAVTVEMVYNQPFVKIRDVVFNCRSEVAG